MDKWIICFWIGVGLLFLIPLIGFARGHMESVKEPVHYRYYIFGGVLASAIALIIPFEIADIGNIDKSGLHVAVSSVNYVLQMFSLNASQDFIRTVPQDLKPEWLACTYTYLISAEFFAAPLLMFTIVAMFFRNATAAINYHFQFFRNVHVFSELNEESLALAKNIKDPHRIKNCIVFTNVSEELEEKSAHLIKKAKDLRAICYRKDILTPNFMHHSRFPKLKFYAISENEVTNIEQAAELIEKYRKKRNCFLYVFTSRPECEYLLNKKAGEKKKKNRIHTRRINAISSLVNKILYDDGCKMLYDASGKTSRTISAVLVGLGRHGTDMLKALTWYGQMYGFKVEINAFDKNKDIKKQLMLACRELFENQDAPGGEEEFPGYESDPGYTLHIYPDTDTNSQKFVQALEKIGNPTYVLVALGDDEDNIRTAVNIRTIFEQIASNRSSGSEPEEGSLMKSAWDIVKKAADADSRQPKIQAIVYNSKECEILKDINNHRKQRYDIEFIGDVESSYTERVLIDSELDDDARTIHSEYSPASSLLDYEYYYRSSCASAIHTKAVAWQLRNLIIDTGLLEKMEFWLMLAHNVSGKKLAPVLGDKAFWHLEAWAGQMRKTAEDLAAVKQFNFTGWDRRKLIKDETLESKDGEMKVLNKEYRAFVGELKKLKAEDDEDFGLGPHFTAKKIADSLQYVEKDYSSKEEIYHCLLTVKLMVLEHERWQAYMRSEGYQYGKLRNDLGKLHPDLVRYDRLDPAEKGKDLHIALLVQQIESLREKSMGEEAGMIQEFKEEAETALKKKIAEGKAPVAGLAEIAENTEASAEREKLKGEIRKKLAEDRERKFRIQ